MLHFNMDLMELAGIGAFVVAAVGLIFSLVMLTNPAARGGLIFYITLFLFLTALSYTLHGGIEIFGGSLGFTEEVTEQLYAVTSVVASLFVFFLVVIVRLVAKLLIRG